MSVDEKAFKAVCKDEDPMTHVIFRRVIEEYESAKIEQPVGLSDEEYVVLIAKALRDEKFKWRYTKEEMTAVGIYSPDAETAYKAMKPYLSTPKRESSDEMFQLRELLNIACPFVPRHLMTNDSEVTVYKRIREILTKPTSIEDGASQ